ncbi:MULTISPECIES: HTH-type transcriptional activator IlvY [unclassified Neptuniibacter]|uniref:HTH-type transcriptional activator IlvY n=1 Tax=unclassified Neptuniibacter TaxID=2630693 RepID=UPI000C3C4061|nr:MULTISPECIES: HTH-type transcriptional activator IlvY [unclassified Neptuniibacter]MAY41265.1 HTH-type transcriptional activator IlvY [Oceanospirillaceae bacterium]|tara:strand:- start:4092 stop:4970 length:879 start_codon:yes stop_codon:yes gene_type:complete
MDIKQLRQFIQLADTLHFGRASEASHISPSALSRSIKQLEEEAGSCLFERDNRSVALTPEGEIFLTYARDSLAQWDTLRTQLMERTGELQGEISMYCSVTASYSFLFNILSEFRRNYPKIEIKLHTGDPDPAINRVISGDEDFAIAAKPDTLPTGLAFKSIALSPLLFIAPKQGIEGKHSTLPILDDKTPMILSEEGVARKRVDRWFKEQNCKPLIYAQVAGNEAIVSMVSLGFGVGVVPKIVLENSPLANTVEVLDITPSLKPYEVGIVTLEKKLKSPLIRAFWAQLKSEL